MGPTDTEDTDPQCFAHWQPPSDTDAHCFTQVIQVLKLLPTKHPLGHLHEPPLPLFCSLNLKWLLQWTIFEIESVNGTK